MATSGATPEKEWPAAFLEALSINGTVKAACAAAGVNRSTAYRRRQADEGFALAWADVVEDLVEELEREARRRAAEGIEKPVFHQGQVVGAVREFSDTLLIFLLKAHRPEMYRERFEVKHGGEVKHKHAADLSKLTDEQIAALEAIHADDPDPG